MLETGFMGDLDSKGQEAHFIGIGGVGMSALARVLMAGGCSVSGCDLKLTPLTERLALAGATIVQGHDPQHLAHCQMVVASAAIPQHNLELVAARERGLPVFKRAQLLGRLMAPRYGIAIAGSHGKTTTSSLIALLLERGGLDPTILVGGEAIDLGGNAKVGQSPYLVAEADEFDGAFWELRPALAVVTNIEAEHLDFYGSYEVVVAAFQRFVDQVKPGGYVVVCGDDPGARSLGAKEAVTYGLEPGSEWRAVDLRPNARGGYDFCVMRGERPVGAFAIGLPGAAGRLSEREGSEKVLQPKTAIRAIVFLLPFLALENLAAHHILGLPHYSYKENYPQRPILEYPATTGPYDVLFTSFPGIPKPGEPAFLAFYLKNRENGSVYREPVSLRILQTSTFGDNTVILPPTRQEPMENQHKFHCTFPDDGEYIVELTLMVEGRTETIPFLVVAGEPSAGTSYLIAAAAAALILFIALRAIHKKRQRKKAPARNGAAPLKAATGLEMPAAGPRSMARSEG